MRRRIGTARNFANKPVFFACDGVQIRRRVSYKAGTKESGRTPCAPERKFYRRQDGRAAGVPNDRRKARRRVVHGAASRAPTRTTATRRGTEKGKRKQRAGEAAHRGGYRGEERGKKEGRSRVRRAKARRAKTFGVA